MNSYTFVLDAAVFLVCIVLYVLSQATYTKKTSRFKYFMLSVFCLMAAAIINIYYNEVLLDMNPSTTVIYIVRYAYYLTLVSVLVLYNKYVADLIELDDKKFDRLLGTFYIIYTVLLLITPLVNFEFFKVSPDGVNREYMGVLFILADIVFLIILAITLYGHKNIVVKRVVNSITLVFVISVIMKAVQYMYSVETFTCFSFLVPIIAVFILLHSNSYDVDFGTLDTNAFINYFGELIQKKEDVIVVTIYVENFTSDMYIKQNKIEFQKFLKNIHYKNFVFKLTENRMAFIYKKQNFDMNTLKKYFDKLHNEYQLDYKTVITENIDMFKNAYDYQNFYEFIETRMKYNTYRCCDKQDIYSYINNQYIKQELIDIIENNNLNDERVLAYCQPILDVAKNKYTSAEALMRLKLDKVGLVFPDVFIPMAEEYKYIHKLSLIILNKVCAYISKTPEVERVSVNFSIEELKDNNFCTDIIGVIAKYNIDYSKIAIEITESRTLDDFNIIKDRIVELKALGFKFYLDDFGTGYSNFERIMGLPIDIIKFDRSLVLFAKSNNESRYMISNFSSIFKKLGYAILFEGIEDEIDESMCKKMKADYLQGYKYSKPIPIDELNKFL